MLGGALQARFTDFWRHHDELERQMNALTHLNAFLRVLKVII